MTKALPCPVEKADDLAACISDIKGQNRISREKLDYIYDLITKQGERNSRQKAENRIARRQKSIDFVREADQFIAADPEVGNNSRKNELLKIYEGVVLVRKIKEPLVENETPVKRDGGEKQEITTFSKKSRLNMIKHLAMMKHRPEFWHDLTYADDVMKNISHDERKLKSSEDMHQFKRWMEREGIQAHGAWKREWKLRKSGILRGVAVPHFHDVFWIDNADERKYLETYQEIADKWLQITGTKGSYKEAARQVLYHDKSFRFIKSQKQMRKYMQKYIGKVEELVTSESIGRSWGLIGDPIEQNPAEIEIANDEMVLLKRMLRRFCKGMNKKVKYGLNFCLSHQSTQFFVLMEKQTIVNMLDNIRPAESVPLR